MVAGGDIGIVGDVGVTVCVLGGGGGGYEQEEDPGEEGGCKHGKASGGFRV